MIMWFIKKVILRLKMLRDLGKIIKVIYGYVSGKIIT